MTLEWPVGRGTRLPANAATFEHLDDRFSTERGQHAGERRVVLACSSCNHDRAVLAQRAVPINMLRLLSGNHKPKHLTAEASDGPL